MSRTILHRVRLVLIACIALVAIPGAGLAAPPTFHDRFDFTEYAEICGVTGTIRVTGARVGWEGEGTYREIGQVTETFTADSGGIVTLHFAGPIDVTFTDNGDGTETIVQTFTGLPNSIRGSQGGVVLRDVGIITFTIIWHIEDEVVLSEVVTDVRGPHPEADSGFTIFCDAFHEALGS